MFSWKEEGPKSSPDTSSTDNNDANNIDNNDNNDNDQSPKTPNRLFSASLSKTKSLFASTTSSIKSASEKAPSILASTKSSIRSVSEKAPSILANTTSTIKSVSATTTSSIKSASEKAPSILANTTSSINDKVKKTSAQIQVINKNVVSSVQDNVSSVSASVPSFSAVKGQVQANVPSVAIPSVQEVEGIANTAAANTMNSLSSILPSRRYAVPDKAVASQVLMYRQILHTECKPGLRLSRGYEATEAQMKVKHMPWWEQGVERSKRMVISYNNLIVRLWLNGAIMPYVDGGYASEHIHITAPKDDENLNVKKEYEESVSKDEKDENESSESGEAGNDETDKSNKSHINTLIDSNGLPPVPHAYWVDRLGFQQTDPVTDFRSGGVLSLAMLVHVVEACPNVHARFLPSGDTHMLPFGITCINITDMLAKFCMLSKAVESMDALLSQKPFWKMFADPNSLLVLQELSMEVLCNVVVELGRERKMPKVKGEKGDGAFSGQDEKNEVTVFDFAEILTKTEKRVHDDLLGSGPRSVDDLRAIHSRNYTKYMKALERKEQQAQRQYERAMHRSRGGATHNSSKADDELKAQVEEVKKATAVMTENVIETAGGVLNKFKSFGFRSTPQTRSDNTINEKAIGVDTEEVDFAMPKSPAVSQTKVSDKITVNETADVNVDLFDMSDAPAPPVIEKSVIDVSIDELFDFDDTAPSSNFTIDDDDFL